MRMVDIRDSLTLRISIIGVFDISAISMQIVDVRNAFTAQIKTPFKIIHCAMRIGLSIIIIVATFICDIRHRIMDIYDSHGD
jgi:hypothetical protein